MKIPKPRPNKHGAVRRDAIKKLIRCGYMLAKCDYHYTDDNTWDAQNNFGRHDYKPCGLNVGNDKGMVNFTDWDFKSSTGHAAMNPDGTYKLVIHGNLAYTLKIKEEVK